MRWACYTTGIGWDEESNKHINTMRHLTNVVFLGTVWVCGLGRQFNNSHLPSCVFAFLFHQHGLGEICTL